LQPATTGPTTGHITVVPRQLLEKSTCTLVTLRVEL